MSRYEELVRQLVAAVTDTPGATAPALRRAIQERARQHVEGRAADGPPLDLDAPSVAYLDRVCTRAYTVTDGEVAGLAAATSDDAMFEMTVSAAVGAGVARLERALALMKERR